MGLVGVVVAFAQVELAADEILARVLPELEDFVADPAEEARDIPFPCPERGGPDDRASPADRTSANTAKASFRRREPGTVMTFSPDRL